MNPGDRTAMQDATLELAAVAAGTARANRPSWLIFLALVAVAAAGVYTVAAGVRYADAAMSLSTDRQSLRDIRALTTRLDQLALFSQAPRFEPQINMISQLQTRFPDRLPRDAVKIDQLSDVDTVRVEGMVRRKYRAAVTNRQADEVLQWLQDSVNTIPGLEIASMSLRPGLTTDSGMPGWNIEIEFTRWERRATASSAPAPTPPSPPAPAGDSR